MKTNRTKEKPIDWVRWHEITFITSISSASDSLTRLFF